MQQATNSDSNDWESLSSESQNEEDTVADRIQKGKIYSSELIFLQSQANMIEKVLGEDENLLIRPECLIGYSNSVTLQANPQEERGLLSFLSMKLTFVQASGPGLLYIDMKQNNSLLRKDQLSLYIILIYALLYLTMFLVLLLDQRTMDSV